MKTTFKKIDVIENLMSFRILLLTFDTPCLANLFVDLNIEKIIIAVANSIKNAGVTVEKNKSI
jgi:hypothetical protein